MHSTFSVTITQQTDEQSFALEQLRRNFGFDFHFGNTSFGGCTSVAALFRQLKQSLKPKNGKKEAFGIYNIFYILLIK